MQSVFHIIKTILASIRNGIFSMFRWYAQRGLFLKILIPLALIGIMMGFSFAEKKTPDAATTNERFVTLASVHDLAGVDGGTQTIGTVRAVTGADVLAQAGGTVTAVNTTLGARVPAGFVIANLENASEKAAVLSAEGTYEAALAARETHSLPDTENSARDTYRSAYTTIDTVLGNNLDTFFGNPTAYGPEFLLKDGSVEERNRLSGERQNIDAVFTTLKDGQVTATTRDPSALLDEAESIAHTIQTLLNEIAILTTKTDSSATAAQITDLATARGSINALLTQISTARSGLRSGTIGATAGADATVKQALGALRAAQANLERTLVRTPVGGQIDFLPIRVGDYVTNLQRVASVSQSQTLEVVANVSEGDGALLAVGDTVSVNDTATGTITSISPVLNPVTKQIEVHIALENTPNIIGGQSVHVLFPALEKSVGEIASTTQTLLLPLTSVKLRTQDRIVFTVNAEGRLEAHPVVIGDVHGDRIEIKTPLPADMQIVADARGLAEGELVRVGEKSN